MRISAINRRFDRVLDLGAHDGLTGRAMMADQLVASRIGQIIAEHEVLMRLAANEYRGAPPGQSPRFNTDQFLRMHPQIINLGVRDLGANVIHAYRGNPRPPEEALKFPWVQRGIASDTFEVGDAFLGGPFVHRQV